MKVWILMVMASLAAGSTAAAQPVVTAVSGTWAQGSTMTVLGTGFGTKSPARPLVWASFDGSLAPSSLGERASWNSTENVAVSLDCPSQPAGASCMKASNGGGVWTASVNYASWNAPGKRSYIYRLVRKNFQVSDNSQNWKVFRIWPTTWGMPDLYIGENNGIVNTENPGGVSSNFWYSPYKAPANVWTAEEIVMQAARTPDVKDGVMELRADGQQVTRGNIATLFSATAKMMDASFPVHFVLANASIWQPAWSDNNRVWVDDVYVDTTWARVMVGNASTYATCTHLVPQIPISWSGTSISVSAHLGALRRIDTAYVYVVDENGAVNATGRPLTQAPGTPQAPRNLRIGS